MRPLLAIAALTLFVASGVAASTQHSLVDRVKDGPSAGILRESFRLLEAGEEEKSEARKLDLYGRGKELAERAIAQDDSNPEAHFALFANWGRLLQTDGWMKNAYNLPALWRELDRTLELDPDHSPALGAKGGLYLQLPGFLGGSLEKAEPLLNRAIELDPWAVGARLELAECYRLTERVPEARDLATHALELAREQEKQRFVVRAREFLEQTAASGEAPTLAASSAASPRAGAARR